MPATHLPPFPYGAVYFRKTNPPRMDWDRDYATARADGMNVFRHWFLWSAIEVAPGEFDWEEYDTQLDLAARHGLRTIIAEFISAAPEWAFAEYAHARFQTEQGLPYHSHMGGSSSTGGFPGLCLDHDDWRARAETFLSTLATRYRGHPGLAGYDLWNEANANPNFCYCPASIARFQAWLKAKYGDLKTLGRAWGRYSFARWDQVTPPRTPGPFPDTLDWSEHRIERAHELLRWRRDLIRGIDPDCAITAHGLAATFSAMPGQSADDWRAAAEVESYGVTWGSSRHGDEPWKQMSAFDLIRAASRGKPFWHAEAYGGPLWLTKQVAGRPRDTGRIASPDDIRYWSMVSFMGGATGMMYLRWRPLLNGPLFGAFGPYGMDGSRTPRSEAVRAIGEWAQAPAQRALWESRPVRGEIGIVYVPESARFLWAQEQGTARTITSIWEKPGVYGQSMQGAYMAFRSSNIQADWVHLDHIDEYDRLYLPIPTLLNAASAARLARWVHAGGILIAEGCPAYWGDGGWVATTQPGHGLDAVFGAREATVEFTPDLLGDLRVALDGHSVRGGVFRQSYVEAGGTVIGTFDDGQPAAITHRYGQGTAILIGTMPGAGFYAHPDDAASVAGFAAMLRVGHDASVPHVQVSDARITGRLHRGSGGTYLWLANPTPTDIEVHVATGEHVPAAVGVHVRWGGQASGHGHQFQVAVGARDVTVVALLTP